MLLLTLVVALSIVTSSGSQEIACDPPIAPKNGYVQVLGDKSSVGSLALYICEKDYIFVGAASSRCLDTGKWTFPTPKCLEQCTVPSVSHGSIAKLEIVNGRENFKVLPKGTKIKDFDDLYVMCEDKYEPTGNTSHLSERIVCEMGEGMEHVRCELVSCRSPPPPAENGVVSSVNSMHGGSIVYHCKRYFRKVQAENITCSFGTWIGVPAVCKDTRCHIQKLTFPGVRNGRSYYNYRSSYYNGQTFTVSCKMGYREAKVNNSFRCIEGTWIGHFPPCIPVDQGGCTSPKTKEDSDFEVHPDRKFYDFGERVILSCKSRRTLFSNLVKLICINGRWSSNERPRCIELHNRIRNVSSDFIR